MGSRRIAGQASEIRFGGIDPAIVEQIVREIPLDNKIVDSVIIPYTQNESLGRISRLSGKSVRRVLDIVDQAERQVFRTYLERQESVPESDREANRIANMTLGGHE